MKFIEGLNWVAILGILIAIETQVSNGTMSIAHSFPPSWQPIIKEWAGNLAGIGGILVTAGSFGQRPAGQFTITPATKAVVMIAMVMTALLWPFGGRAMAADNLATKASPAAVAQSFFNPYPYGSSGFIVGLYTEGGAGSVQGSVAGVNSASLTTTQAGAGLTLGYAWGKAGSPVAYSVEADFGWTNFNGTQAGLSLSGPAAFEQRFVVFTPLASILNLLPVLNSALGTVPPFPAIGNNLTASNLQLGLMAGLDENDISLNFPGLPSNREWQVAPMIGLVAMEQLSNGAAIRSWVKNVFPERGQCVGPIANACGNKGNTVKVGVGIYY